MSKTDGYNQNSAARWVYVEKSDLTAIRICHLLLSDVVTIKSAQIKSGKAVWAYHRGSSDRNHSPIPRIDRLGGLARWV